MKKKIISPVLTVIWVVGILILGYTIHFMGTIQAVDSIQEEVILSMKVGLIYKGTLILLIATVVIYLILNHIVDQMINSLNELTEQAIMSSNGENKHNVRNYNISELDQLAHAFDTMGEKFYRTIRKLNYQKTKVESILTHLDEGIIVLDEEGYVREINQVGEQMLSLKDIRRSHCHIKDILRDSQCIQMIRGAIKENIYSSCEITRGEGIYYVKMRAIEKEGIKFGYIITLQDFTNIRKLEEIRYQFVSNVTHEIKTPLTSIQGFVETLKDGAIENKATAIRFLDIIDIEAQRLYRLIQDILLLSEIENMDNVCKDVTYVKEVVQEVTDLLQEQAQKKEIKIVFEEKQELILENTSRDHIKQTVLNIMSNALRYTDTGYITVTVDKKENMGIIQVKDTGIGIPKESLTRIFERFYRVDKSRSRKSGGTGLGLSIVKHIVGLYRGRISVESEEGKGSCFTIEIPL